jgi:thiamine transporter ThiT
LRGGLCCCFAVLIALLAFRRGWCHGLNSGLGLIWMVPKGEYPLQKTIRDLLSN